MMTAGTVPVSALEFVDALHGMAQSPERWIEAIDAIERLRPLNDDDPVKPLLVSFARRAVDLAEGAHSSRSSTDFGADPAMSGILVSPLGLVRGISEGGADRLRPFLATSPEVFRALRFERRWQEDFLSACSVASSGKHGGYAHLRLEKESGESLFLILMNRRVFPSAVYRMFGLNPGGAEPLLAVLILGEHNAPARDMRDGQILGLTPAEWRLALELRQGQSVSDAALALGVSVNTARTQVKSIFAKLGVARQSELVRRLEGYERLKPHVRASATSGYAIPRKFAATDDGRRIAFRDYGDPRGQPVLFFHQWFASSLLPVAACRAMEPHGLRLVAIDRPGFGQSGMSGEYTFESVARDAIAVADSIRADEFSIMAVAPGAPFAVAAALEAPTRVRKLALVAPRLFPVQHDNQRRGQLARNIAGILRHPWAIGPLVRVMRSTAGERLSATMLRHVRSGSERDRVALSDPETCRSMIQMGCDAHESSAEGFIAELELFSRGQFPDIAQVRCDAAVWHGEEDPVALLDHTLSVFGSEGRIPVNVLRGVGAVFDAAAYGKVFDWISSPVRAHLGS